VPGCCLDLNRSERPLGGMPGSGRVDSYLLENLSAARRGVPQDERRGQGTGEKSQSYPLRRMRLTTRMKSERDSDVSRKRPYPVSSTNSSVVRAPI